MNVWKGLAMCVAIMLLGFWSWHEGMFNAERATSGRQLLPGMRLDQIRSLQFSNPDGSFSLVRATAKSGWEIEGLKDTALDTQQLDTFLEALTTLEASTVIEPGEGEPELSAYGLANPQIQLAVVRDG